MERQIPSVKNSEVLLPIILELFDHLMLLFVCLINWGFIANVLWSLFTSQAGWALSALPYYTTHLSDWRICRAVDPARRTRNWVRSINLFSPRREALSKQILKQHNLVISSASKVRRMERVSEPHLLNRRSLPLGILGEVFKCSVKERMLWSPGLESLLDTSECPAPDWETLEDSQRHVRRSREINAQGAALCLPTSAPRSW